MRSIMVLTAVVVSAGCAAPQPQQEPDSSPSSSPTPDTVIGGASAFYIVGRDIESGVYHSDGPIPGAETCFWSRGRDTSGKPDAMIAQDVSRGPVTLLVLPSDGSFATEDCEPWHKIG